MPNIIPFPAEAQRGALRAVVDIALRHHLAGADTIVRQRARAHAQALHALGVRKQLAAAEGRAFERAVREIIAEVLNLAGERGTGS